MATDYKIVVVPDTGGTRPCIECPQCLGLQLLFVLFLNVWDNSVHGCGALGMLLSAIMSDLY